MRRRIVLLTLLVTLVLWLGFGGQTGYGQEPEPEAPAGEPAAAEPAAPEAPSAEDVMQQLMQRRRQAPPLIEPSREPAPAPAPRPQGAPTPPPTIPLTPPTLDAAVVGPAPHAARPTLLREGQFVVQRKARILVTPDGTHIAVFDQDQPEDTAEASLEPLAPMVLLRSRRLESIEEVLSRHGADTVFRLTGPVYVYRGANYMLPTQAAPTGRHAEAPAPASSSPGDTVGPQTESDRITEQLLQRLQQRSPALPTPESSTTQLSDPRVRGVAPGTAGRGAGAVDLLREGDVIVARRGRLIRTAEGYQLFVFEADDRQSPEPPLLLQPSGLLMNMESIVTDRGDAIVFIVSGQVQTYRGANYLLPTMMKVAVPKGNLGLSS